ncbi:shikimate kinase [bacterium]|nr:shikimate kinase [bacterium]
MVKNIALTGMSGAGKTTTANILGGLLPEFSVVDTDELIINDTGLTIPEIFAKFGEEYFRKKETEVITAAFKKSNQIISLGGGAFECETNQKIIKENSIVIYLKTNPEILLNRLENSNDRPLLENCPKSDKIREILNQRSTNYEKSDIIIETNNKTPDEIAQEIIEALKE